MRNDRYLMEDDSNRLLRINDGGTGAARRFVQTDDGHTLRDIPRVGEGTRRDYVYTASGRLSTVRVDGAVAAGYTYDAMERRVIREVTGGTDTHFIYGSDGRPLAEHDAANGSVIREYIWLNDLLIGMVQSGQLYHVHGGHLGQPLMVTDAAKQIVWQAELSPFGASLPSVGVDGDDPGLRFPGQWQEGETGLLQNWHRDYDPSLGRYVQADPLGLGAGQSLYGYVGGDPVNWVDPEGLFGMSASQGGGFNRAPKLGPLALVGAMVGYAGLVNEFTDTLDDWMKDTMNTVGGGFCPIPDNPSKPIPLPYDWDGGDYDGAEPFLDKCLQAAGGNGGDWNDFCSGLPGGFDNNVVGGGSEKEACYSKGPQSEQEKKNWCYNQFSD